jgi:hypothetical protein
MSLSDSAFFLPDFAFFLPYAIKSPDQTSPFSWADFNKNSKFGQFSPEKNKKKTKKKLFLKKNKKISQTIFAH